MDFGETARAASRNLKAIGLIVAAALMPASALAAAPAATAASAAPVAAEAPAAAAPAAAAPAAAPATEAAAPADKGSYTPMAPTEGKGMPVPKGLDVQTQFSPIGEQALPFHHALLWLSVIIAVFVLGLLLFVMIRFNKRMNPVPSKTSHNTLIEIVWTVVPILILLVVFVPSMKLLGKQFEPAPANAVTIKATGSQWLWTYSYPDNGGFEVISNMLKEKDEVKPGERFRTDADGPSHLAADNRMVVPAGEPIRMQVTAADVIHAFAMPSLWFKIDAVPGKINEHMLIIKEPGVYFGQCSELCGARHGYMPIVIEALPRDKFNAWVLSQGGTIDGQPKPAETPAAAPAAAPAASPAAAAASAPATPAAGN